MKVKNFTCKIIGCRNKAREIYKGMWVCKYHTCRCNDVKDQLHRGCYLHSKSKK